MNGLKNHFDKSYREYSLAHDVDLVRFWRLNVKGQGHSSRRGGEDIHVDDGASRPSPSSSFYNA